MKVPERPNFAEGVIVDQPAPYRTEQPLPTGPTPPAELAAARARIAWRSFWRHRGEEIAAVFEFCDKYATGVAVGCLIIVIFGGGVMCESSSDERTEECALRCGGLGARDSIRDGKCYCIDENGRPWPWREWPGVEASDED